MTDLNESIIDLSTIESQTVVSEDGKTSIKYRVVAEVINLEELRQEKKDLEEQLEMPEPSDKELIEEGKAYHPYYQQDWMINRLIEVNKILEVK